MIDSHAHLNASYTVDSISEVITSFMSKGGTAIIDVTTTLEDIPVSQSLIKLFPKQLYATVGIHPEEVTLEAPDAPLEAFEQLRTIIPQLHQIIGIGETGLDYKHAHLTNDPKTVIRYQTELFLRHVAYAKETGLPLIIHARGIDNADTSPYSEILTILEREHVTSPVYFHSFAGNQENLEQIITRKNFIGINGIITYSGAKQLSEIVAKAPISAILLETDSPYLIPSNTNRSDLLDKSVNEPQTIPAIAKRIAALKNLSEQDILKETECNTRLCFAKIL